MSQLPTNSPESSAGLSRLTSVTEDKIAGLLRGYVESDCLQCPKDTIDSLLALLPENAPCSAEVFHVAEICLNIARTISYTETSHRTLALFLRDLSQSPKFVSELTLPVRNTVVTYLVQSTNLLLIIDCRDAVRSTTITRLSRTSLRSISEVCVPSADSGINHRYRLPTNSMQQERKLKTTLSNGLTAMLSWHI